VLIALGIAATALAALYGAFFPLVKRASAVEDALGADIEAGRFLERFSREVRSSVYSSKNPLTRFKGEFGPMGSMITFASFTHPSAREGPGALDMASISYYVSDENGSMRLSRESWNPFVEEKTRVELPGELTGLDLRFYNGKDWSGAWDSDLEHRLPDAVRATVTLKDGTELSAIAATMVR
jgi:hypothetical protein